eukprot:GHRQ01028936.1.p1 GENE.GHRQ01028936.1~~GHRQ01028936.1.p1  ORF type:complete len:137 (+),score=21.05 GHRQ01028936.1:253-663(+)
MRCRQPAKMHTYSSHSLDVIRHAHVEVLIRLLPACSSPHPAQLLADLPHVCVHWELCPAQAEHQHAGDGLGPHALVAAELCFYVLCGLMTQVLQAEAALLLKQRVENRLHSTAAHSTSTRNNIRAGIKAKTTAGEP